MERIAREQDRIDTDAAPDRDRRNRELKEQQLSEDFGSPRRRRFTLEKRSDVETSLADIIPKLRAQLVKAERESLDH